MPLERLENMPGTPVGEYFRDNYFAHSIKELVDSVPEMTSLGLAKYPEMMKSLSWRQWIIPRITQWLYEHGDPHAESKPYFSYNVLVAIDRVTLQPSISGAEDRLSIAEGRSSLEVGFPDLTLERHLRILGITISPEEARQKLGRKSAVLLNVDYSPTEPTYSLVQVFDEVSGRAVRSTRPRKRG